MIKFGFSSREYVLLHENSKEDDNWIPVLIVFTSICVCVSSVLSMYCSIHTCHVLCTLYYTAIITIVDIQRAAMPLTTRPEPEVWMLVVQMYILYIFIVHYEWITYMTCHWQCVRWWVNSPILQVLLHPTKKELDLSLTLYTIVSLPQIRYI